MKLLLVCCFFSLLLVSCQDEPKTNVSNSVVSKSTVESTLPEEIQEEDCDDKAKKIEEEVPETISLQGGDTGCSLDEINQ